MDINIEDMKLFKPGKHRRMKVQSMPWKYLNPKSKYKDTTLSKIFKECVKDFTEISFRDGSNIPFCSLFGYYDVIPDATAQVAFFLDCVDGKALFWSGFARRYSRLRQQEIPRDKVNQGEGVSYVDPNTLRSIYKCKTPDVKRQGGGFLTYRQEIAARRTGAFAGVNPMRTDNQKLTHIWMLPDVPEAEQIMMAAKVQYDISDPKDLDVYMLNDILKKKDSIIENFTHSIGGDKWD